MSPRLRSRNALENAVESAGRRDGVISRVELRELGISRFGVRDHTRAGRWRTHGRQTVALHTGELSELARRWRAIYEVGQAIAALDGVSALQASGLAHVDEAQIHVSIPHGRTPPLDVVGFEVCPHGAYRSPLVIAATGSLSRSGYRNAMEASER